MNNERCTVRDAIALILPNLNRYDGPTREASNRMLRLLTEIGEGKGLVDHLEALKTAAKTLEGDAREAIGVPILTLAIEKQEDFLAHIKEGRCPAGVCFVYQPAPCQAACPAHIDIPKFITLIGQCRYDDATEVILKDIPFPWTCGLICPHPCEDACLRGEMDEPINIQLMKAYTAKMSMGGRGYRSPLIPNAVREKVAIIGGGPAGLSAAYFLALKGYKLTVFEKQPLAGGMLRYGIPAYRLPRDIIEAEIHAIEDLGVEIRTGVNVGKDVSIEQLRKEGYKAIFLGIGAQECKALSIEGEDLEGVYPGVDFLREINSGNDVKLGNRVAVIGGGNVAMDTVRTARRIGSKEVFVLYRRSFEEITANKEEIQECEEEGIEIHILVNPKRIIGENGKVKAIECIKMKLGEPDESGRRRPLPIEGSEFIIEVDVVMPAIGQESEWSCLGPGCACTLSGWGTMNVDPLTLQTDDPDIFAGGDAVTGPRTVIEAIVAGKRAAISIDCYIRGEEIPDPLTPKSTGDVAFLPTTLQEKIKRGRSQSPKLPVKDREGNFRQVDLGLTDEMALNEARRCLRCDRCRGDGLCQFVCTELGIDALRLSTTEEGTRLAYFDFENTHEKCIGCGACAVVCPYGCIEMKDENAIRRLSFCGTVIAEHILERCEVCGTPFATKEYLELVKERSDDFLGVDLERNLCPACARRTRAVHIAGEIQTI